MDITACRGDISTFFSKCLYVLITMDYPPSLEEVLHIHD